ncbi:hypothetical protein V6N11_037375 [Hibiscus sabdariffa]|uniref:NADH dehydrogenase [ubiquinone] iron-sulfur protein 5-B n=1 Tax=Hibiscus sabdariffa TaxID=183260 RepID=A0ABR2P1W4_9ROSI
MASGWGINGTKGRCYDFWVDFSECMSRCREPKDCGLLREDYLECLHHSKEFQRRNRIYKEEQRKLRAAARKDKEGKNAVANTGSSDFGHKERRDFDRRRSTNNPSTGLSSESDYTKVFLLSYLKLFYSASYVFTLNDITNHL